LKETSPESIRIQKFINANVLKIVEVDNRELASQFANAEKVIDDIDNGNVFDDIRIEFKQLL